MTINVTNDIADSKEFSVIFNMEAKVLIKALPYHTPDQTRAKKSVLTVNYYCDTLQQIEECEHYINTAHKINHMKAILNHGQKLIAAIADSTMTFNNNAKDNIYLM
eukprot:15151874-Ditylum_brightwellii.AAC.1